MGIRLHVFSKGKYVYCCVYVYSKPYSCMWVWGTPWVAGQTGDCSGLFCFPHLWEVCRDYLMLKILYQPSLLSIISRRLVRFLGLLFLFSLWQIWWVLIRDSEGRKQHLSPAYPSMWRMASVARLQGVLRGFGVFYLRVEGVEIFALFLWGRLMESDKSSFAWVQVYIKAWDKQNSKENELTVKGFIQFLFDLMGNLPRSWKMKS